jgi:hypothetical protein
MKNKIILFIVCVLVFYITMSYSFKKAETNKTCIKVCVTECIDNK